MEKSIQARDEVRKAIGELKVDPNAFDAFGCKVFTICPDAAPEQVRDAADYLLDLVERISTFLMQNPEDVKTFLPVIQFLSTASLASYRSLVGVP
jgi:hypothetical protein